MFHQTHSTNRHLLYFVFYLLLIRVNSEQFNYLFSIIENYSPYRHLCFGTSLTENLLITSADCVLLSKLDQNLIAVKFNSKNKPQRYNVKSIHVHGNFNISLPANDNLALIKIENTNKKFLNKYYNVNKNHEFSIVDYFRNDLKSIGIFENAKNLTNYIFVEETVKFISNIDCLQQLVKEPLYQQNILSKNSICTSFYSINRFPNLIINWSQQRGAPLLMLSENRLYFVAILIRIDGSNRKPLVFLRLSLYFDWIQKFI